MHYIAWSNITIVKDRQPSRCWHLCSVQDQMLTALQDQMQKGDQSNAENRSLTRSRPTLQCFASPTQIQIQMQTQIQMFIWRVGDQSLHFDSKYKTVAPANLCVEWDDAIHSRICPKRRLSSKLCLGQEEAKVGQVGQIPKAENRKGNEREV